MSDEQLLAAKIGSLVNLVALQYIALRNLPLSHRRHYIP
jgi:hypothetical protein